MSVIGANYFISSNSLDSSWKKVFQVIFEHKNLEYEICIFFYASHCINVDCIYWKYLGKVVLLLPMLHNYWSCHTPPFLLDPSSAIYW